ncbi:MAG: hypothetical protein RJA87_2323 [Pseudomonadota bacterium]
MLNNNRTIINPILEISSLRLEANLVYTRYNNKKKYRVDKN